MNEAPSVPLGAFFYLSIMNEKLSLLTELVKLMRFDRNEKVEEFNFITAIAKSLNVPAADCAKVFEEYHEFIAPEHEVDRIVQFQRLVLLANIDLGVSPREMNFLQKAGLKLGLNPDAVSMVLNEMKQYDFGKIPHDRLVKIFKVYHN